MTSEEAKTIKSGDIVWCVGQRCQVVTINNNGVHGPYFRLVAEHDGQFVGAWSYRACGVIEQAAAPRGWDHV